MAAADYSSYYGTLASYFGQSGGTGSPGKSGGPGYNNDQSTGTTQGDSQQASASSGSAWISAAASTDTTDKSNFSTPFTQGFGGITNNQIIGSPGATNSASTSPISGPAIGAPAPGGLAAALGLGGLDPLTLVVLAAVLIFALRR